VAEDIRQRAMPEHEQELQEIPAWIEAAQRALATGIADGQVLSDVQKEQLRGRLQRREAYLDRIREISNYVLPTRTAGDTLTLSTTPVVRLLHFEGHTRGDLAVWLPAQKILISGDLLDDLPYMGHGSPRALLETLRAFAALGFETVLPGHGAVQQGSEHLRRVTALVASIVTQVDVAVKQGRQLEETQKSVDLSSFRAGFVTDEVSGRYWDFFMGEAVKRAWDLATGRTR
jgi:glyoxylase-like metal-dependent hydrolase (beta-lactamase superfamily II)